jgi:hypothetical protein
MRVFKQKYRDRKNKLRETAKWYVEFKDHTETTRRLPGFTDKKIIQELGRRIEKLVAFRVLGNAPDPEMARWLESLPNELRGKLTKHSLLEVFSANSTYAAHHLFWYVNNRVCNVCLATICSV